MKKVRRFCLLVLMFLSCTLCACGEYAAMGTGVGLVGSFIAKAKNTVPDEQKYYYDLENVVLYLDAYGELPLNYITKKEAKKRGWEGGSVEKYVKNAAIGGDYYGNFEKKLPKKKGIKYYECDIDTHGYKNRGSRRLIYSNEGKYYYTQNHYESFREVTIINGKVKLGKEIR